MRRSARVVAHHHVLADQLSGGFVKRDIASDPQRLDFTRLGAEGEE
ncbi:MAG: hypothetical protein AAFQ65_07660 [Myxococcota bacterium]